MKNLKSMSLISLLVASILSDFNSNEAAAQSNVSIIKINPKEMRHIGSVDERYQSYNVEMVEVVGGEFWKPYKLMDSLPSLNAASNYDVSQKNEQMYRKLSPANLADKR